MTCEQQYLNRYPDIAAHPHFGTRPRKHYINWGRAEGRIGCDAWDAEPDLPCDEFYLSKNPDVAADPYFSNHPRDHYDDHGRAEGRVACDAWQNGTVTPPDPNPATDACELEYLSLYPDVAAHPYYGNNPREHYHNAGKSEGRQACPEWRGVTEPNPVDPSPPTPPTGGMSGLPKSNIIYIDDMTLSLTSDKGGDFNAPNDFAFITFLQEHYGKALKAVGATCVGDNKGVSGAPMRQILDEAGFSEVPVFEGSRTYDTAKSPLSDYLVTESRKGKIVICVGGPCNDVAQAIKQGMDLSNVTPIIIGRGTWNEWTNPNTESVTRANTSFVYSRMSNITDITWYRDLLPAPKGVQWNEDWIKKWRERNTAFDTAFGDFVNSRNRHLQSMQQNGNNPMRIADFMTVDHAFGGLNRVANFDQVIARVERGIKLNNIRQLGHE